MGKIFAALMLGLCLGDQQVMAWTELASTRGGARLVRETMFAGSGALEERADRAF